MALRQIVRVGYGAGGDVGVAYQIADKSYGYFGAGAFIYYSQCFSPKEGYFSEKSAWCRFKSPLGNSFEIYFNHDPPADPDHPYIAFSRGEVITYGCECRREGTLYVVTL